MCLLGRSNEAVVSRLDGEKNSDLGYLGRNRAPVTPSQVQGNAVGLPRQRVLSNRLQVLKQNRGSPCKCIGGVSLVVAKGEGGAV